MQNNSNGVTKNPIRARGNFIVIFCLGFFTISVQALLFRDFLNMYDGTELAIGFFYFAWFLWIAIGALIGKIIKKALPSLLKKFELLILGFIPAYIIQYVIIYNARAFCSISPLELFPLFKMLPLSFFALGPVSICTGLFFTLACEWKDMVPHARVSIKKNTTSPVSSVYIAEVSGGAAGGFFVTGILSFGISQESIFLLTAFILVLGVLCYRIIFSHKRICLVSGILCGLMLLMIAGLIGNETEGIWSARVRINKWSQLIPAGYYRGSFSTSQAQYHFGRYKGIFTVISWGTICERYPDDMYGDGIAALHYAQNPGIKNVLIIGQGALPVCGGFLHFPGIKQVVWASPDPAYTKNIMNILPPQYKNELQKLTVYNKNINTFFIKNKEIFDLVIIHLPDPATLVLNSFYTKEFYQKLKKHMSCHGILSVRTSAGENYLGSELARIGASVYTTLGRVFHTIVITPGEQSWLLASDDNNLTNSLNELKTRYKTIPSAGNIYPVQGLELLYQEDRTVFQKKKYDDLVKEAGEEFLLNTSEWPKALLHSLLFSMKKAGKVMFSSRIIRFPAFYGIYIILGGMFLYCLLRVLYCFRSQRQAGIKFSLHYRSLSVYESMFLIFSAGVVGISVNIFLIFIYQIHFGNVYLHIGMISALFMLGLSAGGILMRRLLRQQHKEGFSFLPPLIVINLFILTFIFFFHSLPYPVLYIALFFISGVVGGCYIPPIARRLKKNNIPDQQAGAYIEFSDHLGATMGGLLTGVVLIPLTGSSATLLILGGLLCVNLITGFLPFPGGGRKLKMTPAEDTIRKAGYAIGGISVFLVVIILLFNSIMNPTPGTKFPEAAALLANGEKLHKKTFLAAGNQSIPYFLIKDDTGGSTRYIFSTEFCTKQITPETAGYGGPLVLAVYVSGSGTLISYTIIQSAETPVYLEYVSGILPQTLIGKNIFNKEFAGRVDTITGATMTSNAIIHTLSKAGREFAQKALGKGDTVAFPEVFPWSRVTAFTVFFLFIIAALVLRKYPTLWGRRLFLFTVVVVCGVVLNIQYSTDHLFRTGFLPFRQLPSFIVVVLVIGIPLVSLLFGNIYCGYLCPFGALQELIGDLRPRRLGIDPDKNKIPAYTRYLKYLVLCCTALGMAVTMNTTFFAHDPLTGFFRLYGGPAVIIFCICILVLSFFYKRIWCRHLCPVGAFLSILGKVALFRPFIPGIMPRHCDLGVRKQTDLDCLSCDRCRIPGYRHKNPETPVRKRLKEGVFLFLILLLVVLMAAGQFHVGHKYRPSGEPGIILPGETGGKARDADMGKIESLIKKGQLSDEEAEFYKEFKPGATDFTDSPD